MSGALPSQNALRAIERLHASPLKLVLEFTGAGSLALYWLHSVGGSSRTILEAGDRYANRSLAEQLGGMPERFVAPETAREMAAVAFRRAVRLADAPSDCVGVGSTATIATDRQKRGEHRCCVAVRSAAEVRTYSLVLTKGARDRLAEERVIAELLLHVLGIAAGDPQPLLPTLLPGEGLESVTYSLDHPIRNLLAGDIRSVTVEPDGRLRPDQPLRAAFLPGSFNPLHHGHESLARVSAAHLALPAWFELSVTNVDKPALAQEEIERRLTQFRWRHPVVLTRAPLFREKAELFPDSVWVIGYDTAVRLVEPRYYGGETGRDTALENLRQTGARFLVAGRRQDQEFRTLADVTIPPPFQNLFLPLPENLFRSDLSSTQIRTARQAREASRTGD